MANIGFTEGQKQRLLELGADTAEFEGLFANASERDESFKIISKTLTRKNIARLEDFMRGRKKPLVRELEERMRSVMLSLGFSEVVTPVLIGRSSIEKMGISRDDHLWKQIIWVREDQCLRPMLAPNLYTIMEKLSAIGKPVKIFEVGQCFRRDTKGPLHLEEFTMMNMVELAPSSDPKGRLLSYIEAIMSAVGLDYLIEPEYSEVYGETFDVKVKGFEVASAAIGPKPMDADWGIFDAWAGVGFGVERLAMLAGRHNSVTRVSRSLVYLDGNRLNVK